MVCDKAHVLLRNVIQSSCRRSEAATTWLALRWSSSHPCDSDCSESGPKILQIRHVAAGTAENSDRGRCLEFSAVLSPMAGVVREFGSCGMESPGRSAFKVSKILALRPVTDEHPSRLNMLLPSVAGPRI
jgi:hypothetical protein